MKIGKAQAMGYPECRGSDVRYPCYAEVKIDGELNWYFQGKLINKSGKTREDCPITSELLLNLKNDNTLLIGELYYGTGKLGKLYDLLSNQQSHDLMYGVWDVKMVGTYEERREWMIENITESEHVKIVPTWYIEEKEELDSLKQEVWGEGYEGLVVKHPNSPFLLGPCKWMKIKKKDRTDYQIALVDQHQERVEVVVPIPSVGAHRNVGVKVCNKYKPRLGVGAYITVEHQGVLSAGGLRHPVYIPKEKGGTL